jgi:hypothetical protein
MGGIELTPFRGFSPAVIFTKDRGGSRVEFESMVYPKQMLLPYQNLAARLHNPSSGLII